MEEVDALVALGRAAPEFHTLNELSETAHTSTPALERALEYLVRAQLATVDLTTGDRRFRLSVTSADEATVQRLVDLYLAKPVSLIRYVYERPADSAQAFADAFRLKD